MPGLSKIFQSEHPLAHLHRWGIVTNVQNKCITFFTEMEAQRKTRLLGGQGKETYPCPRMDKPSHGPRFGILAPQASRPHLPKYFAS